MNLLLDVATHKRLSQDPTENFQKELQSLLRLGVEMGMLSQSDAEKLFVQ